MRRLQAATRPGERKGVRSAAAACYERRMSLASAALLGLGLGIKHALEADHLAAVCTIVSRGGGAALAARSGALWGAGHGAVIVLAGGALVLSGAQVPASLATVLDIAVAVMLVALGISAILGGSASAHTHAHARDAGGAYTHDARAPGKPLLVGCVHGASGTAALTLLVATTIPARADGLTFIALFGLASILGMAAAAALVALPLGRISRSGPSLARAVRAASGLASVAAGLMVAWTTLVAASPS